MKCYGEEMKVMGLGSVRMEVWRWYCTSTRSDEGVSQEAIQGKAFRTQETGSRSPVRWKQVWFARQTRRPVWWAWDEWEGKLLKVVGPQCRAPLAIVGRDHWTVMGWWEMGHRYTRKQNSFPGVQKSVWNMNSLRNRTSLPTFPYPAPGPSVTFCSVGPHQAPRSSWGQRLTVTHNLVQVPLGRSLLPVWWRTCRSRQSSAIFNHIQESENKNNLKASHLAQIIFKWPKNLNHA